MRPGVSGSMPALYRLDSDTDASLLNLYKYEKNMNFILKPPGCKLRRLILEKLCAKMKKVICKHLASRKAYLYVGE